MTDFLHSLQRISQSSLSGHIICFKLQDEQPRENPLVVVENDNNTAKQEIVVPMISFFNVFRSG